MKKLEAFTFPSEIILSLNNFNPIRMGIYKICHTYATIMKPGTVIPYLRKILKKYRSCDTFIEFCYHQHFLFEISKFCYIKKYRYRLHFDKELLIILTFFEYLKIVVINMVTIFMIPAKMATLGLLKIKVF